jgi:hypothetical protein
MVCIHQSVKLSQKSVPLNWVNNGWRWRWATAHNNPQRRETDECLAFSKKQQTMCSTTSCRKERRARKHFITTFLLQLTHRVFVHMIDIVRYSRTSKQCCLCCWSRWQTCRAVTVTTSFFISIDKDAVSFLVYTKVKIKKEKEEFERDKK